MSNCSLRLVLMVFLVLTTACSTRVYPDRSQFLRDGEEVPTVDLNYYRSVQERPGQDANLAVAVAISGGGSRAANFGMGVMLGLEEILYEDGYSLLDQIDYLSTVSGGGFAGGAYIAARYDHQRTRPTQAFSLRDHFERYIRDDLQASYVKPLIAGNFNPKLWFSFLDDGDVLEKAIDDRVLGHRRRRSRRDEVRSIRLGDMFIHRDSSYAGRKVYLPWHITNSSVIRTMTIFPFTPDILDCYKITGYSHRLQILKAAELDYYKVPLAVGIKASGSFPVLISNSTLHSGYSDKRKYLHLMDGAMTDNIGYYTAIEVLKQEGAPKRVLFVVDADAAGSRYTFSKRRAAMSGLGVYTRLASSGLEARRATMEKDIVELGSRYGIKPVVFSFNLLIRNNEVQMPRLIRLLKRDMDDISDADLQILYELLTSIGTKYTMKEDEQELLILAGQKIVRMQAREIEMALW